VTVGCLLPQVCTVNYDKRTLSTASFELPCEKGKSTVAAKAFFDVIIACNYCKVNMRTFVPPPPGACHVCNRVDVRKFLLHKLS